MVNDDAGQAGFGDERQVNGADRSGFRLCVCPGWLGALHAREKDKQCDPKYPFHAGCFHFFLLLFTEV